MNIPHVLAQFDREQRIEVQFPGLRREVVNGSDGTVHLVRQIALNPADQGSVIYSRLTVDTADTVIRREIDHFTAMGQSFEWKYYSHDQPPDLLDRLRAHGFTIEDEEAFLVLDIAEAPAKLRQPPAHPIRRIIDPALVSTDVIPLQREVWGEDMQHIERHLALVLREEPDHVRVYVAYADDVPVCSAWMYFEDHSAFAGLWGGSTLPAYRKRGIYGDMLAVRLQEAERLGKRFLTIDASPMSRPIVEAHGFTLLATTHPCIYHVER